MSILPQCVCSRCGSRWGACHPSILSHEPVLPMPQFEHPGTPEALRAAASGMAAGDAIDKLIHAARVAVEAIRSADGDERARGDRRWRAAYALEQAANAAGASTPPAPGAETVHYRDGTHGGVPTTACGFGTIIASHLTTEVRAVSCKDCADVLTSRLRSRKAVEVQRLTLESLREEVRLDLCLHCSATLVEAVRQRLAALDSTRTVR